jgi:hypothetical protein
LHLGKTSPFAKRLQFRAIEDVRCHIPKLYHLVRDCTK